MPREAVFTATCLAAAIGSAIMGLYANYPIALAPGMGLNAYFAFVVVGTLGYSWQTALGAVFISGCLFLIVSALRIREWIIDAIPASLKFAISAGVGFFLALIGLKNAGLVAAHPATFVTLGDLHRLPVLLAVIGFLAILALEARRVTGAVVIAILGVTLAAVALGLVPFKGLFAPPPSLAPPFWPWTSKGRSTRASSPSCSLSSSWNSSTPPARSSPWPSARSCSTPKAACRAWDGRSWPTPPPSCSARRCCPPCLPPPRSFT